MCDIVWVSPQEHWLESESFHFFLQALQWTCPMRKRFRRDHCCRGRAKPGCRIVGSSTRCALITDHWPVLQWLGITTANYRVLRQISFNFTSAVVVVVHGQLSISLSQSGDDCSMSSNIVNGHMLTICFTTALSAFIDSWFGTEYQWYTIVM